VALWLAVKGTPYEELAVVMAAKDGSQTDRLAAQSAFILERKEIWNNI
jgi:hypothetical protein